MCNVMTINVKIQAHERCINNMWLKHKGREGCIQYERAEEKTQVLKG